MKEIIIGAHALRAVELTIASSASAPNNKCSNPTEDRSSVKFSIEASAKQILAISLTPNGARLTPIRQIKSQTKIIERRTNEEVLSTFLEFSFATLKKNRNRRCKVIEKKLQVKRPINATLAVNGSSKLIRIELKREEEEEEKEERMTDAEMEREVREEKQVKTSAGVIRTSCFAALPLIWGLASKRRRYRRPHKSPMRITTHSPTSIDLIDIDSASDAYDFTNQFQFRNQSFLSKMETSNVLLHLPTCPHVAIVSIRFFSQITLAESTIATRIRVSQIREHKAATNALSNKHGGGKANALRDGFNLTFQSGFPPTWPASVENIFRTHPVDEKSAYQRTTISRIHGLNATNIPKLKRAACPANHSRSNVYTGQKVDGVDRTRQILANENKRWSEEARRRTEENDDDYEEDEEHLYERMQIENE
ncbi:hypothetical protein WN51_04376 [Melipona quadrifasciata]|uniref:Uncharacterized protein n=1 Tax=Melipona quadrifasciata TaxID=166423 RepID=A0A0N0BCR4_9HYME|nr:hypothetical protein WN51_04376 [Melipona quadrifasciata]